MANQHILETIKRSKQCGAIEVNHTACYAAIGDFCLQGDDFNTFINEAADVYNKHDISMQDAYYFAAWPYFEASE